MRRTDSYNERFSQDIRNPVYAQNYFLELTQDSDEPMTPEEALKLVIRKMGTTEFAAFVGERVQNVDKFLKGERNPKRDTLDKFLRPFGLVTVMGIKPINEDRVA